MYDYDYNGLFKRKRTTTLPSKKPVNKELETSESNEISDEKPDKQKASRAIRYIVKRSLQEENITVSSDEISTVLKTVNITGNYSDDGPWNPLSNSIEIDNYTFKIDDKEDELSTDKNETSEIPEETSNLPHFHVTYWMFYPYSQGKSMCTLNIPLLGPLPIPLIPILNICLGTKKEFGGHVGDWEHMSLFFKGKMHPEVCVFDGYYSQRQNI
jgi:hypothetical protein